MHFSTRAAPTTSRWDIRPLTITLGTKAATLTSAIRVSPARTTPSASAHRAIQTQTFIAGKVGIGITNNLAASLHVFSTNQFQLEVEGAGFTAPAIRLAEEGEEEIGEPSVCDMIGVPGGGMDWYVNYPTGPELMTLYLELPDTAYLNLYGNFNTTGYIIAGGTITADGTITGDGDINAGGNIGAGGTVTATSFNTRSDRNAKENFAPVNPQAVLAKVAALPVTQWNYKTESGGSTSARWRRIFRRRSLDGADDKHISVVDEGGVALAAIQGLNQKLNEKDAEIQDLKQRLEALEKIVLNQKPN